MTLFIKEGRWMVTAARRYERIVQVGTQQRSGPHYQKAREVARAAYFGKLLTARMGAFQATPGFKSLDDQRRYIDYELWSGPAPESTYNPHRALYHFRWFWDYSGGQSPIARTKIHIVQWYIGARGPLAVSSSGGRFALEDNGEIPRRAGCFVRISGLHRALFLPRG